jgi:hypothetical protein
MDELTANYLRSHLYSLYAELGEAYADSALYFIEGGIETTQHYLAKYGYAYESLSDWQGFGKKERVNA